MDNNEIIAKLKVKREDRRKARNDKLMRSGLQLNDCLDGDAGQIAYQDGVQSGIMLALMYLED